MYRRFGPRVLLLLFAGFAASASPAQQVDMGVWLGAAPIQAPGSEISLPQPWPGPVRQTLLPSVNNDNRYRVGVLFQRHYAAQAQVPYAWAGNVASCKAGSNSVAHRQAVIDRVNLYRVVAGLPGNISLAGGAVVSNNQQAALMFSANQSLSHDPPANWLCWTQAGHDGAAQSNIALGYGNDSAAGTGAVDLYMDDPGPGNSIAGHRRWLLYPPRLQMDTGSIPWTGGPHWTANALYVFGATGARPPRPEGVAWPGRGYMPAQLLPASSHRWSLSLQNANFNGATVAMWRDGVLLSAPAIEPMNNGQPSGPYYGDNTIVWLAHDVDYDPRPAHDVRYRVRVSGIQGSGIPAQVEYEVIVFDAMDPIFADGFSG